MGRRVILCLLLFHVMSITVASNQNDCHPKGYGSVAIHACADETISGSTVAMDTSRFNGNFCKCILTRVNGGNVPFVVDTNYISGSNLDHRVRFYIDGKDQHLVSGQSFPSFNKNSVVVMAERQQVNTDRGLRIGGVCLVFKLPEDSIPKLYLACFNGTSKRPDINDTRPPVNDDPITTVRDSKTVPTTQSPSTSRSVTASKLSTTGVTTTKHASSVVNSTTTPSVVSSPDNDIQKVTTTVGLQGSSLSDDAIKEEPSTDTARNKDNVTGIVAGAITAVVVVAVIVVMAISIAVICYFKRRKRESISNGKVMHTPEEVPKPKQDEEEYEITENAMYIPTIVVEESNHNDIDRISNHTYEEAGPDIKRDSGHDSEVEPLLKKENDTGVKHYEEIDSPHSLPSERNTAPGTDTIDDANANPVSDEFPVYSQVDKSNKRGTE